jgi:flotillin
MSGIIISIVIFLVSLLIVILGIAIRNFHVIPTNGILLIQGFGCPDHRSGKRVKAVTGQWCVVWPLFQKALRMSLTPWDIHVLIDHVYAQDFIPLGIRAYCQVAIGTDDRSLENAAQHLADKGEAEIVRAVKMLLEGVVRSTIAMMDPMKAMTDKEEFARNVTKNSKNLLHDLGLRIIGTMTIQTVEDPARMPDGFIAQLERREQNRASMNKDIATSNANAESAVQAERFRKEQRMKQIMEESTSIRKEMDYKINKVIGDGSNMANKIRAENSAELERVRSSVVAERTRLEAEEQRLEANVIAPARANREVLLAEGEQAAAKIEKEELTKIDILEKKLAIINAAGPEGIRRFILENMEKLAMPITRTMEGAEVESISLIDSAASNSLIGNAGALLKLLNLPMDRKVLEGKIFKPEA